MNRLSGNTRMPRLASLHSRLTAMGLAAIMTFTGGCVLFPTDGLARDEVQFENRSDETVDVFQSEPAEEADHLFRVEPGRRLVLATPSKCVTPWLRFLVKAESGQVLAERSMATDPLCRGDLWVWPEPEPSASPSP